MKSESIDSPPEFKRLFLGIMFSVAVGFSAIGCQTLGRLIHRDQFSARPDFNPLEIRRIAIIAQDNTGKVSEGGLRIVEDVFSRYLIEKGYELAARSRISAVETEIGLQRTEMTDAQAAQIGRILRVDAVLVISIARFSTSRRRSGGQWHYSSAGTISARLIDLNRNILASGVRSSSPVTTSSTTYRGEATFQSIARGLARSFPERLE